MDPRTEVKVRIQFYDQDWMEKPETEILTTQLARARYAVCEWINKRWSYLSLPDTPASTQTRCCLLTVEINLEVNHG